MTSHYIIDCIKHGKPAFSGAFHPRRCFRLKGKRIHKKWSKRGFVVTVFQKPKRLRRRAIVRGAFGTLKGNFPNVISYYTR